MLYNRQRHSCLWDGSDKSHVCCYSWSTPIITSPKNNFVFQGQLSGCWKAHHSSWRTIRHYTGIVISFISENVKWSIKKRLFVKQIIIWIMALISKLLITGNIENKLCHRTHLRYFRKNSALSFSLGPPHIAISSWNSNRTLSHIIPCFPDITPNNSLWIGFWFSESTWKEMRMEDYNITDRTD